MSSLRFIAAVLVLFVVYATAQDVVRIPFKRNPLPVGQITVGTPGQPFNVVFDTGSTSLWVPSSQWPPRRNKFDFRASSTFKYVGKEAIIKYGSGTMKGITSNDTVGIGGLRIKEQPFIQATESPDGKLYREPWDGILGLMGKPLSTGTRPVWESMMEQGVIKKNIFSIWLHSDSGELVFGGTVPGHFTGVHTFVDTEGPRNFFKIYSFFVGKSDTKICSDGCQVIVDSGSSRIRGPHDFIVEINKKIGAAEDCSNYNKLSEVSFKVAGKPFSLTPRDYIERQKGKCKSLFADSKIGFWILGTPFIGAFHTVWDYQTLPVKVGFAKST